MKRKYSGTRPFYEVIDRQWSVDPCDEEREDDAKEDEKKREEERLKRLEEGIQRKLKEIIPEKAKENASPKLNAFLLLVIDDIESREEENNIMGKLEGLLPGDQNSSLKVLITRREEASRAETDHASEGKEEMKEQPEIEPSSEGKAESEKDEIVEETDRGEKNHASEGKEEMKKQPEIEPSSEGKAESEKDEIVEETDRRAEKNHASDGKQEMTKQPEEVIAIGRLSEYESFALFKDRISGSVPDPEKYELRIEHVAQKNGGLPVAIVILIAEAFKKARDSQVYQLESALEEAENEDKCLQPLLRYGINMLQSGGMDLVNWFWRSREFFSKQKAIHHNVLILSWILEGYFGSDEHVEKAYEQGYEVMMELISRGLLKMEEDNLVTMERLALEVPDDRPVIYERPSNLGLPWVLEDHIWQGFGTIAPAKNMIKTPCRPERLKEVSTLLMEGSRLFREVPDKFFKQMQGLQHLAIFSPMFKSLPAPLSKMKNLCLLVLRDCEQLLKIDHIRELKLLNVLEMSGARLLEEELPDDFFEEMKELRSLNLSSLAIKSLPSTLSKLTKLRWLILRGCSSLERLPKIRDMTDLEVLDLCGAPSLQKMEDKCLKQLQKLQLLDVSYTKIERLPILGNVGSLTRLVLRGSNLTRLPLLKAIPKLQYLDISGSTRFKEIKHNFSENKGHLKILNLSNTAISRLPSTFGDLTNLESLDLSGCSKLVEIPESTVEEMESLRRLILRRCPFAVPEMEGLKKLVELDLSECSALTVVGEPSVEPSEVSSRKKEILEPMSQFQIPSVTNLTQLLLSGCSLSESKPNFRKLTKLEVLDLSQTGISSLPFLDNLTSLRELKLRENPDLKELQNLERLIHFEVLDLRRTGIKDFPHKISKLIRLKQLDLPKGVQLDLEEIKVLPEKLNWDECGIFQQRVNRSCVLISDNRFSRSPKKESEFCKTCLKEAEPQKSEFFVRSLKDQGRAGDQIWHRVDTSCAKVYLGTISFLKNGECLQILGSDSFHGDEEDPLGAEYVSFIENKFIERLSDIGEGNVKAMKGCWLERCMEMETIFCGDESEAGKEENLEILWASNLPKLNSVYSEKMQRGNFQKLTAMYLDCCPMLKYVFPSSAIPQMLEILQIKFCDELESLFDPSVSDLQKYGHLKRLHLVGLPKLSGTEGPDSKSIYDIFTEVAVKVWECPKLEIVEEIVEHQSRGSSIQNSDMKDWVLVEAQSP